MSDLTPTPVAPPVGTPPAPGATPPPPPPAAPPAPEGATPPPATPPEYPPELGDAGKRALDAERDRARAAEQQLRELTAERDALRQQQMTEQERAVEAAKADGRTEALATLGPQLVDAEIRAASVGRLSDEQRTAALLHLDRKPFLNDDGTVDVAAVEAWVAGLASPATTRGPIDLGQGRRPGTATGSKAAAGIAEAQKRFGPKAGAAT